MRMFFRIRAESRRMSHAPSSTGFATAIAALFALGHMAFAQEEGFTPPQAYPVDRYEAGWNKNPFTLKTAPVALEKESALQDLAIGSLYGQRADPIVAVVNTKTGQRTRLKTGETAQNGMLLKSVSVKDTQKETSAEVVLNGETAILKFDYDYYRQNATPRNDAKGGAGENPAGRDAAQGGAAPPHPSMLDRGGPPARGGGVPDPANPTKTGRASIFNNPAIQRNMPPVPPGRPSEPRPTPGGRMLNTAPTGAPPRIR
jgi:hypothetical protein